MHLTEQSNMEDTGYIKAVGIFYKTELRTIPKKNEKPLQPIFEAFTNSWESIQAARTQDPSAGKGSISIDLFVAKNLLSEEENIYDFDRITITDSGIGFNDKEYERFLTLRDDRKNFKNKGTGRIQFLHTFDKTVFNSVYRDMNSSTGFFKREITLSKSEAFLKHNAIIRLDSKGELDAARPETSITFYSVLDDKERIYFNYLSAEDIQRELIRHYLAGFCEHRNELPEIVIRKFIGTENISSIPILPKDIPVPTKEQPIDINYSRVNESGIEKTRNKEPFVLKAFVIPKNELDKNSLKLISKGEEATEINLRSLIPSDEIDGFRYLFLLSGKYIDERDSDTRGEINLLTRKDLKNRDENLLFGDEEILLEDIEEKTNQIIINIFDEIREKATEKEQNIKKLQQMFLLNDKTLKALKSKININDSDDTILRKVYEADAKIIAKKDAEIKHQIESLSELDTTSDDYQEKLTFKVNEFVKTIPIQNRTALTQYVARRRMVIDLFGKILNKEIEKLKGGGRIDENLMHNLIFQQSSDNPENSDLWLIAEDYIYFKGVSEIHLNQLEIDGEKVFKNKFTEEEERYLNSLGEKRLTKRPDVLLFPSEGKCILVEFKAPGVNVSEHLSQIDFYANLIRNYTIETFQITTFYGYLIGENIEDRDVRGRVSRFEHSYHLDYWFRPSENVVGFDRKDGSIYTEVIKYSTLLKRAELRNKIFIQKLESSETTK